MFFEYLGLFLLFCFIVAIIGISIYEITNFENKSDASIHSNTQANEIYHVGLKIRGRVFSLFLLYSIMRLLSILVEIYIIESSILHSDVSKDAYRSALPKHDRIQIIQHASDYQTLINYIRFIPNFLLLFVMALFDRYSHKLGLLLNKNRESEWVDVFRVVILVASIFLIVSFGNGYTHEWAGFLLVVGSVHLILLINSITYTFSPIYESVSIEQLYNRKLVRRILPLIISFGCFLLCSGLNFLVLASGALSGAWSVNSVWLLSTPSKIYITASTHMFTSSSLRSVRSGIYGNIIYTYGLFELLPVFIMVTAIMRDGTSENVDNKQITNVAESMPLINPRALHSNNLMELGPITLSGAQQTQKGFNFNSDEFCDDGIISTVGYDSMKTQNLPEMESSSAANKSDSFVFSFPPDPPPIGAILSPSSFETSDITTI